MFMENSNASKFVINSLKNKNIVILREVGNFNFGQNKIL